MLEFTLYMIIYIAQFFFDFRCCFCAYMERYVHLVWLNRDTWSWVVYLFHPNPILFFFCWPANRVFWAYRIRNVSEWFGIQSGYMFFSAKVTTIEVLTARIGCFNKTVEWFPCWGHLGPSSPFSEGMVDFAELMARLSSWMFDLNILVAFGSYSEI